MDIINCWQEKLSSLINQIKRVNFRIKTAVDARNYNKCSFIYWKMRKKTFKLPRISKLMQQTISQYFNIHQICRRASGIGLKSQWLCIFYYICMKVTVWKPSTNDCWQMKAMQVWKIQKESICFGEKKTKQCKLTLFIRKYQSTLVLMELRQKMIVQF